MPYEAIVHQNAALVSMVPEIDPENVAALPSSQSADFHKIIALTTAASPLGTGTFTRDGRCG
jgi:hypothetical protein